MTALMTLVIIDHGSGRTSFRPFQFVFGVDEKTTERDNLGVFPESVEHLCIELSLNARVNLVRDELARLLLDVHDVLLTLLDDRLVRSRQEWPLFDDDLHDVEGSILSSGSAPSGHDHG